jgi:hypothetical protein
MCAGEEDREREAEAAARGRQCRHDELAGRREMGDRSASSIRKPETCTARARHRNGLVTGCLLGRVQMDTFLGHSRAVWLCYGTDYCSLMRNRKADDTFDKGTSIRGVGIGLGLAFGLAVAAGLAVW